MKSVLFKAVISSTFIVALFVLSPPSFSSGIADPIIRIASTVIVLVPDKKASVVEFVKLRIETMAAVNEDLNAQVEAGSIDMAELKEAHSAAAFYACLSEAIGEAPEIACRILVEDICHQVRIPIGLPNKYLAQSVQLAYQLAQREQKVLEFQWKAGGLVSSRIVEAETRLKDVEFLMEVLEISREVEK